MSKPCLNNYSTLIERFKNRGANCRRETRTKKKNFFENPFVSYPSVVLRFPISAAISNLGFVLRQSSVRTMVSGLNSGGDSIVREIRFRGEGRVCAVTLARGHPSGRLYTVAGETFGKTTSLPICIYTISSIKYRRLF